MSVHAIRELFAYNRWANDKVMGAAADLSDEQLDRPFEMGPGSLRATLRHVYGSERTWCERMQAAGCAGFPRSRDLASVKDVWDAARGLSDARRAWLDSLTDTDLDRRATYTAADGQPRTHRVGDILLQSVNHGIHHRAQALNMLRQLGADVPGLDYIVWIWGVRREDEPR